MPRCGTCSAIGFCAVDCAYAPWNVWIGDCFSRNLVLRLDEKAPSPFAYILRFRRWLRSPPDRRDVFFIYDREAQALLGRNFWRRDVPTEPLEHDRLDEEEAREDPH